MSSARQKSVLEEKGVQMSDNANSKRRRVGNTILNRSCLIVSSMRYIKAIEPYYSYANPDEPARQTTETFRLIPTVYNT